MDANDIYGSNYLKCQDLNGQEVTVTILGTETATFNDGKKQILLVLREFPKKLGLNKTNANTLIHLFGPKTEGWDGKRITLRPDITQFQGKTVDCVRLRPASQQAPNSTGGNGPLSGFTDRVIQTTKSVPRYEDIEPDEIYDPLG